MPEHTIPYCALQPAIAAHRGASMRYPENSLAAIKEAINIAMRYPEARYYIEADVRKTRDGQLILMHDSEVSRVLQGSGATERMTYDQLRALPFKPLEAIVSPSYIERRPERSEFYSVTAGDLRVASLEEVVALVRKANAIRKSSGTPIGLALELKHTPTAIGKLSKLVQHGAGIAAMLLDKAGLHALSALAIQERYPAKPLADFLNGQAKRDALDFPLMVFAVSSGSGNHAMEHLWFHLSKKARGKLAQQGEVNVPEKLDSALSANAPYAPELVNTPHARIADTLMSWVDAFHVVGAIPAFKGKNMEYQPIITTPQPVDTVLGWQAGLQGGASIITTNYPEHAAQLLRGWHVKCEQEKAAASEQQQPALHTNRILQQQQQPYSATQRERQ